VQLTPPGSACSIALMTNLDAAGTVNGLHLIVNDIDAARSELVGRGVPASDIFHFEAGGQMEGPDPGRSDYNSFVSSTTRTATAGWCRRSVAADQELLQNLLHADVAGGKPQAFIEPVRLKAARVGGQLHDAAAALPGRLDGPGHERPADTSASFR
jgi:hypothetical protein